MPIKNIIPGQRVTKEKLQRAKELRREMGLRIIRFRNDEVLKNASRSAVLERIKELINQVN